MTSRALPVSPARDAKSYGISVRGYLPLLAIGESIRLPTLVG